MTNARDDATMSPLWSSLCFAAVLLLAATSWSGCGPSSLVAVVIDSESGSSPQPEDTAAPTIPLRVRGEVVGEDIRLSWQPSTDNQSGVVGYNVYVLDHAPILIADGSRDGVVLRPNPGCGLFTISVTAIDGANNESERSAVVRVLMGTGCGGHATFRKVQSFRAQGTRTVTSGDFNGDGASDFAANTGECLEVFVSEAATEFEFPTYKGLSACLELGNLVVTGDLDGDGVLDLANSDEGTIQVFLGARGTPDGALSEEPVLAVPRSFANSLVAGDFDNDGAIDLASGDHLLLGAGDGSFTIVETPSPLPGAAEFIRGDVNGDSVLGADDLTILEEFLALETSVLQGCFALAVLDAGDVSDNEQLTLADSRRLALGATGPAGIPAPDACGVDPDHQAGGTLETDPSFRISQLPPLETSGDVTYSFSVSSDAEPIIGCEFYFHYDPLLLESPLLLNSNPSLEVDLFELPLSDDYPVVRVRAAVPFADLPLSEGNHFVAEIRLNRLTTQASPNLDWISNHVQGRSRRPTVVTPEGTDHVPSAGTHFKRRESRFIAADLNQDGILDSIVLSAVATHVRVSHGSGDRTLTFEYPELYDVGPRTLDVAGNGQAVSLYSAKDVVAEDLDNDGIVDLAVAHHYAQGEHSLGYVTVLFGDLVDGRWQVRPGPLTRHAEGQDLFQGIVAADFDGDGHPDLALACLNGGVRILHNDGFGAFAVANDRVSFFDTIHAANFVTAVQLDADGVLDLLVATSEEIQIWRGDRGLPWSGTFSISPFSQTFSYPVRDLAVADLTQDGVLDIVLPNGNAAATDLPLLVGNGSAGVGHGSFCELAIENTVAINPEAHAIAIAQENSLGIDVVIGGALNEIGWSSSLCLGLHDYICGATPPSSTECSFFLVDNALTSLVVSDLALADFDGDSGVDVVVAAGDRVGVFLSANGSYRDFGVPTDFVATGDLNSDGAPDFVVSGGLPVNPQFSVRLGSPFGVQVFPTAPASPEVDGGRDFVLADFDQDGVLDLVMLTENGFDVLRGDGSGAFATKQSYLFGGSQVEKTDVDRDGVFDLIILDENVLRILLGTLTAGKADAGFEEHSLVVLPDVAARFALGDFNGDGVIDIVYATALDQGEVKFVFGDSVVAIGAEVTVP